MYIGSGIMAVKEIRQRMHFSSYPTCKLGMCKRDMVSTGRARQQGVRELLGRQVVVGEVAAGRAARCGEHVCGGAPGASAVATHQTRPRVRGPRPSQPPGVLTRMQPLSLQHQHTNAQYCSPPSMLQCTIMPHEHSNDPSAATQHI